MASELIRKENNLTGLGIKVEGDLGDLEIIESSDSEGSDDEKSFSKPKIQALDVINSKAPGLLQPATAPVLSNVSVANSENVQFGNNTYFHGPVTIKQVIKRGLDNASYVRTESENESLPSRQAKTKQEDKAVKSYKVPPWLKAILSVTSVLILGIICALAFILQNHSQDDKKHYDVDAEVPVKESSFTQVVGICYDKLLIIIFIIITVPITILLMLYSLLTNRVPDGDTVERKQGVIEPCILDYPLGDFNDSVASKSIHKKDDPLLIAPNHLRIVPRTDWLAQPVENELDKIRQPVPWVVITHTATEGCDNQSQCVLRVRLIQMFHIESKNWDDIGYNFLVAGDGSAYYGRGWDYIGAHTLGYNRYSIGIAFIGTFKNEAPPQKQIDACTKLIKLGVQLGKIRKDYKLFAHRQLSSTQSPGDKLFDILKQWPHFVSEGTNLTELTPKDY